MGQIIEYSGIEEKLATIRLDGESTQTNLNAIERLIKDSVGEGGAAWSGESASQFRSSWDELAAEIPGFIDKVKAQAANVELMLEKTKATDQNGAVKED